MTGHLSQPQLYHRPTQGFGRMLALSLLLHSVLVAFFLADLFPHARRDLQPLYYVDLINLPVRNPQAGRPDARPQPQKAPEPAPTPPAAKPAAKPEPPKMPPAKAKQEPAKTVAKETPKAPAKPEPKVDEYAATANTIERMRQKKEFEENLAALKASRQSAAVEAPVGMPTGKGKEAGPDEQLWIQKYLKESWNLSKYQVTRRDLKATARLVFDADGRLLDYRIAGTSGDANFDESVRRAILKAKQLPFRPERRLELNNVEFNLKDLLD